MAIDDEKAVERVPESERTGWYSLSLVLGVLGGLLPLGGVSR